MLHRLDPALGCLNPCDNRSFKNDPLLIFSLHYYNTEFGGGWRGVDWLERVPAELWNGSQAGPVTKQLDELGEVSLLLWAIFFCLEKGSGFSHGLGLPGGSDGKESACSVADSGSVLGLGRSPGEGIGNPLQYLAWRIPWTEEPGSLQSLGSQSVRHNGATFTLLQTL